MVSNKLDECYMYQVPWQYNKAIGLEVLILFKCNLRELLRVIHTFVTYFSLEYEKISLSL